MDAIHELMLRAIESARREKRYRLMRHLTAVLMAELASATETTERWRAQAKVSYELHMADYQQAVVANGKRKNSLLLRSWHYAERSAREAEMAGDAAGALFAEMNISGLILPALDRWREALEKSSATSERAEILAAAPDTTDEDRKRSLLVAVNCYFHRGRIIVAQKRDRTELARLREKIETNPVYQEEAFKNDPNVKADIASFDDYVSR